MRHFKNKVKKEFESQLDTNLNFNISNLKSDFSGNSHKKVVVRRTIIIFASILTLCAISIPIFKLLDKEETLKLYKKTYVQSELKQIEKNSFKKLNDINYPDGKKGEYKVSKDYYDSIIEFSNKLYPFLEEENSSFSPLNLYMNLNILSLASNNNIVIEALDNLLGMTKETRAPDFVNAYKNDYFYNDYGTIQMYNGYFATNKYDVNNTFINNLTKHYTEAYQVDFNSSAAVNKILNWIDQKVQDKNFLSREDLNISDDTAFLLMSTFYFRNNWNNPFINQNTKEDKFYLDNEIEINVPYLRHSYYGEYYDYGDYISCYDYFKNGQKIKYIISKGDTSNNTFELVKNKNIFQDDENKKNMSSEDGLNPIINLKMPKFESEYMIDFSQILKDNGLAYLFDELSCSFNDAFTNLPDDISIYLDYVKQKNLVSFNEEGTMVKSVTVSSGNMATTSKPTIVDTIDVNLNRPFIYIIYDTNDLPIFVGNLHNPLK